MTSPLSGSSPEEPEHEHTRVLPSVPDEHQRTGTDGRPGTESSTAPPTVPPRPGTPGPLAGMTARHWWVPVLAGVGGYVGTVVGVVIALLLTAAGAAVSGSDSGAGVTDTLDEGLSDVTGAPADFTSAGKMLAIPFQISAMAFLSPLRMIIRAGGETIDSGVLFPLYAPLACGALVAWLVARRLTRSTPVHHRAVQWIMAAVAGVSWALLALLVTLLTQLRFETTVFMAYVNLRFTGVSATLFVVALLVGALTVAHAVNIRSTQSAPGQVVTGAERLAPGMLQVVRPMAVHLGVFALLAGPLVILGAFIKGGAVAGFSSVLWLPVALGNLWVQSMLSAVVSPAGSTGVPELTGSSNTAYLWSVDGVTWWMVLLCLLIALVATVCAAVTWAHVRPVDQRVGRVHRSWVVLPVAYFLLGLLLMRLLRVHLFFFEGSSHEAERILMRPAGWTCLVLLIWGVVIEVLARFVAPRFLHVLPRPVTRVLRGSEHSRARAGSVAAVVAGGGAAMTGAHGHRGAGQGAGEPASSAHETAYAGGAAPGTQPTAREPMDPATKKRLTLIGLIVVAVLALIAAGLIVYGIMARTMHGPEKKVEEYMDAVVGGEATRAAEIVDPNVRTEQRGLLTDEIFEDAEHRIDSYDVTGKNVNGNRATVNVDLTQDNVTTSTSFHLKSDGRDGLFKTWAVDTESGQPLYENLSVSVPAGVEELTVNDHAVSVARQSEERTVDFPVLPGDYTVSIPAAGKYISFGDARTEKFRVDSDELRDIVRFERTITPALEKDLAGKLNAKLDECATKSEFEPEGCGFGYSTFGDDEDYRNPSWSITKYPTYSVMESGDGAYFSTDKAGEARLEYQHNDEWDDDEPADWVDEDYEESLYISGDVTVEGDTFTVTVD